VNPGRRQKVADVQVQGNTQFSTRTIRERMFIQPASFLRLRHGRYSAGFVRRDEAAIKDLYQSNGFRDVKVSTRTIDDYHGKPDEIGVVVRVVEGPQYLVSGFSIDGVKQIDQQKLVSTLSSVPGEPYSDLNIALDRNYILTTYNAQGFSQATFSSTVKPAAQPHRMEVHYAVNEGPRKYVREVVFSGFEETKMRLVEPVVRLKPNDPLSIDAMTRTQRDLYNLGIFDEVDTAIQNPDGDTDDKYVLYQITEGHRYSLAAGLGAEFARIGGSNDNWSSPGGETGFSPRASVDFSRLNLWGLGHTATFKGVLSTLQQTASLSYLAPRYHNVEGRNITVTGLYDLSRDVRTFTGKRVEGSVQLSQKFSRATTMLYRFSYRRVSVDPGSLKIEPLLVPLLSQPARVGMLSTSLVNDRRDDPSDAHRGIYSTLDGGVATKGFGSQVSFLKFLGSNATYKTFHQDWVFAQRTQFGFLRPFAVPAGVDPTQAIPLPERWFSGGSTSLRSFPDNQAGPRDTFGGFPLGGNALLIHNTEVRFPFLGDNMDGVLFHDMGNVYTDLSHISFRVHQRNLQDFDYMTHAVGFGIRYRTPVGPVRLDLAYSINPPQFFGFKGTTIEVLTGVAPRVQQSVSHFQFFFSIGQAF
jgi:outer membrane protein insertion porin family